MFHATLCISPWNELRLPTVVTNLPENNVHLVLHLPASCPQYPTDVSYISLPNQCIYSPTEPPSGGTQTKVNI